MKLARWQEYLLSLICQIGVPLFPLLLEFCLTNKLSEESLTLTASIYTITIGVSSRQKWQLALAILASLFFAAVYGAVAVLDTPVLVSRPSSTWGIITVSITHGLERFYRHVIKGEVFWDFS
ncbi:MAG: hypothetical protein U7127_15785 [Phormidium sp.]